MILINSQHLRQGRADEFAEAVTERKEILAELLKTESYDELKNGRRTCRVLLKERSN